MLSPQHDQIDRSAAMHRRHLQTDSPLVGIAATGIRHRQEAQAS